MWEIGVMMSCSRFCFSLFATAFFVAGLQCSSAQCPSQPVWRNAVCGGRAGSPDASLESLNCWEEAGRTSLECQLSNKDFSSSGFYDVSHCVAKSCSSDAECGTGGTCGEDLKCVVTGNDLLRAGTCEYNCNCFDVRICSYDQCLDSSVCKPANVAKKRALCKVVYDNGEVENRTCLDNPDFVCVKDREESDVVGASEVWRCDHKRCESDIDCSGTCEGPGKCDPDREDPTQGKFGTFFSATCSKDEDCIGGYECCRDHDFLAYQFPKLCRPPGTCNGTPQDRYCGENSGGSSSDSGSSSSSGSSSDE